MDVYVLLSGEYDRDLEGVFSSLQAAADASGVPDQRDFVFTAASSSTYQEQDEWYYRQGYVVWTIEKWPVSE